MENLELGEVAVAPIINHPVIPLWILAAPEIEFSVSENMRTCDSTYYGDIIMEKLKNTWQQLSPSLCTLGQDAKTEKSPAWRSCRFCCIRLIRLVVSLGASPYWGGME